MAVPFVGRERECKKLDEFLDAARRSEGVLVLLTGAAGIGKSRLASEMARAATSFQVHFATCGPADSVPPYWPWMQVVRDLLAGDLALAEEAERRWPAVAALGRATSVVAGDGRGANFQQARAELFEDTCALLSAAALACPQLILLDDLHDADASSLLLLAHLSARLPAAPMAVVGTWRTGDRRVRDDASDRVLRSAHTVALAPLAVEQIAALIEATAGSAPRADVAAEVYRRSSGNPLLAQELIAQLQAKDVWDDPSLVAALVPEAVRVRVTDCLAALPPATAELVTLASLCGTRFRVDIVAEAVEVEATAVADALGETLAGGLLTSLDSRQGSFAHDVVRDAVLSTVPAGTRADLHLRAGKALERLRDRGQPVELAELTYHFLEAGPAAGGSAVAYAAAAGSRAMSMLAYEDAVRVFTRALAVAPSEGAGRAELLVALGDAQSAAGERAAARATHLHAAAAARDAGRFDLLARAALGVSGAGGFEVSMLDREQISLLEESLAALPADSLAARAWVMARLSVAVSFVDAEDRRLRLSEAAVQVAREAGDDAALAHALAARCDALAGPDHIDVRADLSAEIVDLGRRLRNPELELLGRRLRVVACLEQGDMAGVDHQVTAFAAASATLRQPLYGWYVPLWRGLRAFMEGRIDDLRVALAETAELGDQAESHNAGQLVSSVEWQLRCELNLADEVKSMMEGFDPAAIGGVWPYVSRALGSAHAGDLERARADLDVAASMLPSAEKDSEWLPMLAQLAETVGHLGAHPLAEWAYSQLLPYRSRFVVEGIGAASRGSVERHLGVLAAVLGDRDEAAAHFEAALASNERIGATLLAARTLRDAGIALDDPALLARSHDLYAVLGVEHRAAELERTGAGASAVAELHVFRRDGEMWTVGYRSKTIQLRDSKGLRDLGRLLAQPSRPIAALDLASPMVSTEGDLGETIDATARSAYQKRLTELQEELDDADATNDSERSARAAVERDTLVDQLASAYGLGGRARRPGHPAERARQAVTARIHDALDRIDAAHPELGQHLRRSVRTGRVCVYEPEEPVTWKM